MSHSHPHAHNLPQIPTKPPNLTVACHLQGQPSDASHSPSLVPIHNPELKKCKAQSSSCPIADYHVVSTRGDRPGRAVTGQGRQDRAEGPRYVSVRLHRYLHEGGCSIFIAGARPGCRVLLWCTKGPRSRKS